MLPHPVNRGYQDLEDYIVETVNGEVPKDMEHLSRLIDTADGRWLKIVTEDRSYVTLDLSQARDAQEAILENFGMPRDRSPGLSESVSSAQAANSDGK